jgi:Flp pilus assembly protein TadD
LHQLETALSLVNERLAQSPGDLEAHGWRGRLLAWQGHWADAESEYRVVLDQAPNDTDVLCGLGDVLLWQGKSQDALLFVERARGLAPSQISILLRRARILRKLGRIEEMRQQFREVLALDPREQEAIRGLAPPPQEYRHEFRAGGDGSTFNYTDPAAAQGLSLSSRWSSRWTTSFATELYQRFGDDAAKFSGGGSLRITQHDWLSATAAFGHTNGSIPKQEVLLEYGHGLRLPNRFMQGLEASYQQHWFWYNGAHVLVLSLGQLYYLPREWTWSFTVTGARSGFTGAGVEWVCSGSTRLEFPLRRQLTANLTFANGTENFAYVDQIGHFSARTYGGGVKYRFAPRRDISGYIAVQDRSQGRRQNSFGVSYGFRF